MYTMKRVFEQRSNWQVTECLIVHVLSSCYNVFEIKGKHRSKGAFVSPSILYSTRSL